MPFSPPVPQAASRKSRQDAVREQEASCGEPGALLGSQRRWNWTVSQARESSRVRQRTLSRDGAKHPEVHGVTCVSSGELLNPRGAWVSSCENCTPDACLGWGSLRGVCGGVCRECVGDGQCAGEGANQAGKEVRMKVGSIWEAQSMAQALKKWFLPSLSSVLFSRSVLSDSLRPHESQHARLPCPSPTPGVHSNSCSSSR